VNPFRPLFWLWLVMAILYLIGTAPAMILGAVE